MNKLQSSVLFNEYVLFNNIKIRDYTNILLQIKRYTHFYYIFIFN